MWVGVNAAGETHELFGGEAWDPVTDEPVVTEHKFVGWFLDNGHLTQKK